MEKSRGSKIIRMGGRSKDENITKFSLKSVARASGFDTNYYTKLSLKENALQRCV